jgi:hypothetical protein
MTEGGGAQRIGETDSEGFVDFLAVNGVTYTYFVTAVDRHGHESGGSSVVAATPRPDYHGELLYAFEDRPDQSGFRFRTSEASSPIVPGTSPLRHFRLEVDGAGWWLVPGPDVQVHPESVWISALRCGPGADAGCVEMREAPLSGYLPSDRALVPEHAYFLRVPAEGGLYRYGMIRVSHVGFVQEGAIVIFDWAFQLQPGLRSLAPVSP